MRRFCDPCWRQVISQAAMMITAICSASISAHAAPLDTLPALKQFTATGNKLDVTFTMNRAPGPVMIGRDQAANAIGVDALTTLTVCDAASPSDCAQPYAGAVLKLSPGDTLKVKLINRLGGDGGGMAGDCMDMTAPWDAGTGWSSAGGLLNQHYHGLLVPPTAGMAGNSSRPFGDFIFTCTKGSGADAEREYRMTLPAAHPAGINWFHPHIHGIAKPQVASGMAGMILVGDPSCADQAACGTVRPILLKDAQLVKVASVNGNPRWLNFADQEPDFCGAAKGAATNLGSCPWDSDVALESGGTPLTPTEGHWVFTLNGAQYPTIVVPDAQLWRVQNASANITYRLSLRRLDGDATQVVADALFQVTSMDGAGLAGYPGQGQLAPEAREILLMPGSRADLLITRPAGDEGHDLNYQLVNEAFQAGFAEGDADTWPRVALADVIFPASLTAPAAGASAAADSRAPNVLSRARSLPVVSSKRVRLPVTESAAAQLRGTPLTREGEQVRDPTALSIEPPPDDAARELLPADPAMLKQWRAKQAMARWLREDCDGYTADDAFAKADGLLKTAVPGHQPITSDMERKSRYWSTLHFNPGTTHRRIYFGIQTADDKEQFVLGETLVIANARSSGPALVETDLYGRRIGPTNPVVLTTFNPDKGLCVLKRAHALAGSTAGVEQWELVNVSKEVHNFHIHQMKFTVARDVNGQPIMRTPSASDLVQLPASLLLTAGSGARAQLQHDTIIVPRGVSTCESSLKLLGDVGPAPASGGTGHSVAAFILDRSDANADCTGLGANQQHGSRPHTPDGSGMIMVNMSFDGDWLAATRDGEDILQPARFVFHCHILEHEDKGMMHRIAVLDPAADAVSR